jgi:hypothetical protein
MPGMSAKDLTEFSAGEEVGVDIDEEKLALAGSLPL